jgi:hypothetical protein
VTSFLLLLSVLSQVSGAVLYAPKRIEDIVNPLLESMEDVQERTSFVHNLDGFLMWEYDIIAQKDEHGRVSGRVEVKKQMKFKASDEDQVLIDQLDQLVNNIMEGSPELKEKAEVTFRMQALRRGNLIDLSKDNRSGAYSSDRTIRNTIIGQARREMAIRKHLGVWRVGGIVRAKVDEADLKVTELGSHLPK